MDARDRKGLLVQWLRSAVRAIVALVADIFDGNAARISSIAERKTLELISRIRCRANLDVFQP